MIPPGLEDSAKWNRGSRGAKSKESRKSRRTSPRGTGHSNNNREEDGMRANSHVGRADSELITMLKIKPKRVPQLRTEEGFQLYFKGISKTRMQSLLERAYEHLKPKERAKKVRRRMALLDGHFGS